MGVRTVRCRSGCGWIPVTLHVRSILFILPLFTTLCTFYNFRLYNLFVRRTRLIRAGSSRSCPECFRHEGKKHYWDHGKCQRSAKADYMAQFLYYNLTDEIAQRCAKSVIRNYGEGNKMDALWDLLLTQSKRLLVPSQH